MGILSNILEKLGMGNAHAEPAKRTNPSSTTKTNAPPPSTTRPNPSTQTPPPRQAEPVAPTPAAPPPDKSIPVVDVVAQLEQRAANNSQKLNWRTSIVDLLKLLDIDSSLESRKELAKELNCPPELLEDSAKMNVWLHKTVLARIAANGGNVPKDLTD
ncbi:MAG: DUF3597 domain-containing protein [Pseudomonadota bacterium]